MPNGKGWLDCNDCKKCKWEKPWIRYCTAHEMDLPNPETIDHQHTVCSEYEERESVSSILNGEVVPNGYGATYYVYRRGSPYFDSEKPQEMISGVLYMVHYNEQVLRPLCEFNVESGHSKK